MLSGAPSCGAGASGVRYAAGMAPAATAAGTVPTRLPRHLIVRPVYWAMRRSFQLQYGASAALHAADVVLSATALLEAPLPAAAAERADLAADEAVRENYMCANAAPWHPRRW